MTRTSHLRPADTAARLHSLGYRNSDFLFSDALLFVEGESDQEILPILLALSPDFNKHDILKTGFPKMDGEGRLRSSAKQKSLLYFEKFLQELGKSSLPRIYLFDGDCDDEDQRVLRETPILAGKGNVAIKILSRCEIENYLLVPEAILRAIRHLASIEGKDVSMLTGESIKLQNDALLLAEDGKLFPRGKGNDPVRVAKGSVLLERVFDAHGFPYRKRNEGRLVAENVTSENQPVLSEIWDLVRALFPRGRPKGRY